MAQILGKGTQFEVEYSDSTYHQISQNTVITWSGRKFATEDTTSHDSTTPVKTLATTIRDEGTFAVTAEYDPADTYHAYVKALSISGASNSFKVINVGAIGTWTFDGFVTDFKLETTVSGLVKASFTVSVTGAITES